SRIVAGVGDAPANTGPVDEVPGSVPPAPVTEVPSNLVWNVVMPDSAEAVGIMAGPMVGDGPFLAWSSEPARSDRFRQVLWRSDDGQSWTQAVQPPVSGNSLAAYDGRFFSFGTTAASNGTVGAAVAMSVDSGGTWATSSLPIDTTALRADPLVRSVEVNTVGFAAGPAGLLLATRVTPQIQWESVLPAAVLQREFNWTRDGVDVLAGSPCPVDTMVPQTTVSGTVPAEASTSSVGGPSEPAATTTTEVVTATTSQIGSANTEPAAGCSDEVLPAETFTWDELGVSQAVADSLGGGIRFFLSVDGAATFDEVAGPAGLTPSTDARLVATPTGFAAWTAVYGPNASDTATWASTDGRSWTELGSAPVAYVDSLLAWGDRLVMTGIADNVGSTVVAVSDNAGGWTTTNLAGLVRPSDGVSAAISGSGTVVGPLGISLTGWLQIDPIAEAGGIETTRDGITVRAEDGSGTYIFLDAASGAELGRLVDGRGTTDLVTATSDSPGGIVVRLSADADPVSFTWEQLSAELLDPFYRTARPAVPLLLHSTDGINWSRDSLDDAAGEPVTMGTGVRVVGSQLVVATTLPSDGSTEPQQQLLLVATPRT
ncbi:MAG: hypothetical protein WEB78_12590, partial [Ilumatobacteraceae bacterium]